MTGTGTTRHFVSCHRCGHEIVTAKTGTIQCRKCYAVIHQEPPYGDRRRKENKPAPQKAVKRKANRRTV